MANLGDGRGVGRGHREVGLHGLRPLDKEAYRIQLEHPLERRQVRRIWQQERRKRVLLLAVGVQRRAARHEHLRSWSPSKQAGDEGRRIEDTLEIVQDQQQPLSAEHPGQALRQPTALVPHAKHAGDGRGDQGRIVEHAQIDEPDAVRKVFQHIGGGLQCHPGLAHTTWSRNGQEADVPTAEEGNNLSNLLLATEKRRQLHGEVVRASGQASNRREVGRQVRVKQLEDPLRLGEIAQRMLTEVAQARIQRQGIARQVLRHQCEQHLTTMGSGHQAGEAIESGSEVIPVMGLSGDGMHRHSDSKRAIHRGPALRCQRPLCIEGRGYGIRGGGEGGLDGIADDFEEHAMVCLDCCPQRVWWRSTAVAIAAWSRSQSAVLPSMSVKRKVTVPEGRSGMVRLQTLGGTWCLPIVARGVQPSPPAANCRVCQPETLRFARGANRGDAILR